MPVVGPSERRTRAAWLIQITGALALAILGALIATGTTYALWSSTAVVNASTVTSGTTGLTVNGATNYVIPAAAPLDPGDSFLAKLTVVNTGTTTVSASFSSATVLSQTHSLHTYLVARVTQSSSCIAGLAGGVTAPLTSFSTTHAPFSLASGASTDLCLEVALDSAAPASVQNGTASFNLNLDGQQVRP